MKTYYIVMIVLLLLGLGGAVYMVQHEEVMPEPATQPAPTTPAPAQPAADPFKNVKIP